MKWNGVLALLLCIGLGSSAFAGGPWPIGKGNGFFQAGFTTKRWDGRYQGTYSNTVFRDLNRQVRESNFTFYGEYGLGEKLTLVGDITYRMQVTSDELLAASQEPFSTLLPAGSLNALSNPGLQLKYALPTQKFASALTARWQPNTSTRDAVIGLQSDYDAGTYSLGFALGNGSANTYWSMESAFMVRGNSYGEGIGGNFQWGYKVRPETYLILDVNYVVTLENGTHDDGNFAQTATFTDNQGYLAYGAKVYSKFYKNLSFNLALYSGFAVVNQGNQPSGIFGGIAYELSK